MQDPGGGKSRRGRTYLPPAAAERAERAPRAVGRAGRRLRGSPAWDRDRAGGGHTAQSRANRRRLRLRETGLEGRQPLPMGRGRCPGRWLWRRLGQGGGRAKRTLRPGSGPKGLGHGSARSPLPLPTLFPEPRAVGPRSPPAASHTLKIRGEVSLCAFSSGEREPGKGVPGGAPWLSPPP